MGCHVPGCATCEAERRPTLTLELTSGEALALVRVITFYLELSAQLTARCFGIPAEDPDELANLERIRGRL